jgi:Methyltransferase domain
VKRHELLAGLHEVLQPRTYLEIGVREGLSLALSRTTSIGVDPAYAVTREIRCDVHLVRTTSDEFFARRHPLAHFPVPVVDLAFVDGMHLAEYALRDVMNIERWCSPGSVIVVDDVLPRSVVEGGRGREGSAARGAWAGDVYKVTQTLRRHRPDLVVLEVDTTPTGTLVVLIPDASDRTLLAAYDQVVAGYVVPDPQEVPASTLTRSAAVDAATLLRAPDWASVRRRRDGRHPERQRGSIRSIYAAAGLTTGQPR